MDFANVLCCAIPCGIGSSGAIQEDVNVVLEVLDGPGFNRILVWIIRLGELVLDIECSMYDVHFGALFLHCIVPAEAGRYSAFPNKVPIDVGKLSFSFESTDVHKGGFEAIEDLAAAPSISETSTICKHGVRRDNLVEALRPHERETRTDVAAERVPDYHFGHLCGDFKCFLDNTKRGPSQERL